MRQRIGSKLLGVLLALAMVVGLMPGMSLTAYAAGSGTIGTASYTIDDEGVLTVGSGSFNKEQWRAIFLTTNSNGTPTGAKDIAKTITKVVLEQGAATSGTAGMFYGWTALQEADLSKLNTSGTTDLLWNTGMPKVNN